MSGQSRSLRFTLAAAALVLACAGCFRPRQPEEPVGASVRVMTFNVNWGGPGADRSARAMLDAKPDIIFLQETNEPWRQYLTPLFRDQYPHSIFRHGRGAGGMAVFSRWPVRELVREVPPGGWFFGWVLEAETPLGPVQVLAVHLHPNLDEKGGVGIGALYSTRKLRLAEARYLHALLVSGRPTLVLGDFNEPDDGRAVCWLAGQGFTDALAEFDRRSVTWHWPTMLWTFTDRFDHILYSRELHCCRAEVLKAGASDHYPVVAVFDRREKEAPKP